MRTWMRAISWVAVVMFCFLACASAQSGSGPGSALTISKASLISPEELAKTLQGFAVKPLILNVGPRMLYQQARIKGAEFIGPGSDPRSIDALKQRVKALPKTTSIVLYCGCCPWQHCPNVAPAFSELKNLGFTNVKVLYLADNIGTDWVNKGYPTER